MMIFISSIGANAFILLAALQYGLNSAPSDPRNDDWYGQDDPQAIMDRGSAYWYGYGTLKENKEYACELFLQASSLGHPLAMFNLGNCYRKNISKQFNSLDKAVFWYKKGYKLGSERAGVALATQYHQGYGKGAHYEEAVKIFEKHKADKMAAFLLADFYFKGKVVPQDYTRALALTKSAADQGHVYAITLMYHIYKEGLFDQKKSKEKSAYWLNVFHTCSFCIGLGSKWNLNVAIAGLYTMGFGVEKDLKKADFYEFEWKE